MAFGGLGVFAIACRLLGAAETVRQTSGARDPATIATPPGMQGRLIHSAPRNTAERRPFGPQNRQSSLMPQASGRRSNLVKSCVADLPSGPRCCTSAVDLTPRRQRGRGTKADSLRWTTLQNARSGCPAEDNPQKVRDAPRHSRKALFSAGISFAEEKSEEGLKGRLTLGQHLDSVGFYGGGKIGASRSQRDLLSAREIRRGGRKIE